LSTVKPVENDKIQIVSLSIRILGSKSMKMAAIVGNLETPSRKQKVTLQKPRHWGLPRLSRLSERNTHAG